MRLQAGPSHIAIVLTLSVRLAIAISMLLAGPSLSRVHAELLVAIGRGAVADFQFVGGQTNAASGGGAKVELKNAPLTPDGLELVRGYENAGDGYRATFDVPGIDPSKVSFVLDFMPFDFRAWNPDSSMAVRALRRLHDVLGLTAHQGDHQNILTGGESYRWIGFNHGPGHLQLTLNNQAFTRGFSNVVVTTREWHRLACSLDLDAREVRVALDGRLLETTRLPEGFGLEVLQRPPPGGDLNFTMANYSNGQAFHGLIARLQVFDRALNADELTALGAGDLPVLPNPKSASQMIVILLAATAVVAALLGARAWRRRCQRV